VLRTGRPDTVLEERMGPELSGKTAWISRYTVRKENTYVVLKYDSVHK
jgi:hypothetical protein